MEFIHSHGPAIFPFGTSASSVVLLVRRCWAFPCNYNDDSVPMFVYIDGFAELSSSSHCISVDHAGQLFGHLGV